MGVVIFDTARHPVEFDTLWLTKYFVLAVERVCQERNEYVRIGIVDTSESDLLNPGTISGHLLPWAPERVIELL